MGCADDDFRAAEIHLKARELETSPAERRACVDNALAKMPKRERVALNKTHSDIPEGLPPGTRRVGETKAGLPLYQTPSGELWVEE